MTQPQTDVLRWNVAIAQPGLDWMAADALKVRGYTVYRPTIPRQFTDRRGRSQDGSKSMFPGYLFVLPIRSGWESLRTAPGMTFGERALLKINGQLATISHNDPDHIGIVQIREFELSRWNDETKEMTEEPKFKVGDQVRIQKGPWIEMLAQIEALDDNERAWVLFHFLGGTRRALISFDHLIPAIA